MSKFGLAAILAVVYILGSAFFVHSEGLAHRKALLADLKPEASEPAVDEKPTELASVDVATKGDRDVPKKAGRRPRVGNTSPNTKTARTKGGRRPQSDPATPERGAIASKGSEPVATKGEARKAVEVAANIPPPKIMADSKSGPTKDVYWDRPDLAEVWDLKHLKVEDQARLSNGIMRAVLNDFRPEVLEGNYLRRVKEAAEPLLAFRSLKENKVTFKVLDGNGWNAFSHPGDVIYVSRGLLDSISVEEEETYILQFVLAHELFHLDDRHAFVALDSEEVSSLPGGTIAHFLLVVLPNAYPDELEFAADKWAYQTMIKLGYQDFEANAFLRRLKSYSEQPRQNFAQGRFKPIPDPRSFLFENHFRAHPAAWERLKKVEAQALTLAPAPAPKPAPKANATPKPKP